ncbi:Holliday junction resolvase RuvX [Hydrogenovibrio sp. JE_KL2]|jgi:putative Holliday junction resolvase|uniref:Holliday junction resolvase RuvX n=1 Tax=Hydrogenovibrio sp. JE_KL2 TaxID=2651188 RepID=UPI00128B0BD8|nr:Holliday junction resolvase RuvX [Hydrogenovibrio sp. JE_KL2]MBN2605722.1 Holliday junction resolvase RuvX [Thiotrichales bacterium]MPQ77537.1 Holliday junction resolvase RuvX [Hydrogenovibrio sp. JE_KL2]
MTSPASKPIEGQVLGFDFGLRRIGVAVGQTITATASPLTIVNSQDGKPDWEAITQIFEQWKPVAIVVGLPMRLNGEEQALTQPARKFGQRLSGRYNTPVFFIEEQLSSVEAEKRRKHAKQNIDDHAAQIILENWLESVKNHADLSE